jgi:glucose uptake protein GlcU
MTSTFFLIVYGLMKRNQPVVFPQIIVPGLLSGGIWATAQCCWFIANAKLSLVVAFPLINLGPGLVGALWGVFVFGEIKGAKNYILLSIAFVLIAGAATMIVISK